MMNTPICLSHDISVSGLPHIKSKQCIWNTFQNSLAPQYDAPFALVRIISDTDMKVLKDLLGRQSIELATYARRLAEFLNTGLQVMKNEEKS